MKEEKRTATIRPSPFASLAGAIVNALLLLFGVTLISSALLENNSETGMNVLIAMFGFIWVIACGLGIFYNIRNYRTWSRSSPNNPAAATSLGVIEYDVAPDKENPADFETKLRKLESLKKDSLITEEEYKVKRREIMNEKW
ncbi:MAG: SHOCT domain-containing protein [Deltaproteobacteria bacterium]|nr:SHOCT domain-containing protein [Deltaproteobacteria bacterium]